MSRAAAVLFVALAAACASRGDPAATGRATLPADRVVVLPLAAIDLPAFAAGTTDSLRLALATLVPDALARAIERTGAARGGVTGPGPAGGMLAAIGSEPIRDALVGLDAAAASGSPGAQGAAAIARLVEALGGAPLLVPRSLVVEPVGPLRVRARLVADLVTSPDHPIRVAGAAENEGPPSREEPDLAAAAYRAAVLAAVDDLARRLTSAAAGAEAELAP